MESTDIVDQLESIFTENSIQQQPIDDNKENSQRNVSTNEKALNNGLEEIQRRIQKEKEEALKEYELLVDKTKLTKLQDLITTQSGSELFNELCMRLDINQKYADQLPQWKDVSNHLNVDSLKLEWKILMRPEYGFTKAMLEIYMQDGGSLGDVLDALIKLKCYEIIEKSKEKIYFYLENRKFEQPIKNNNNSFNDINCQAAFYSIIATLESRLGTNDPMQYLHQFKKGIRIYYNNLQQQKQLSCNSAVSSSQTHDVFVSNGNDDKIGITCDSNPINAPELPIYRHDDKRKIRWNNNKPPKDVEKNKILRVLLLCATDGQPTANEIVDNYQGHEFEGTTFDFFRLYEESLWPELLVNTEGSLTKWIDEADYVMPILTPNYLKEIQGSLDETQDLIPVWPIVNRFAYNLLRIQYSEQSCHNVRVRPCIPMDYLSILSRNKLVRTNPLFRMVWTTSQSDKLLSRFQSMAKRLL